MTTRSKKKKKPKNKKFSKETNRLEVDLKYTLRAIDGKHEVLDSLFLDQANKIRGQIKKLEENQ